MRKVLSFFYVLFVANMLNGFLPEYGRTGGWDYSAEEATRDCAEYGKRANVYYEDVYHRIFFACVK